MAKVRIKAGSVEFEYEGDAELSVQDIKDLFSHIEMLFKAPAHAERDEAHAASPAASSDHAAKVDQNPIAKLHVNSVAQALKAKSGVEVAVAAAATLQIVEGKPSFTRNELLDTMKKATMHYNTNMSSNLTKILGTLVGSKFNQLADGVYSLKADQHQKLATEIA